MGGGLTIRLPRNVICVLLASNEICSRSTRGAVGGGGVGGGRGAGGAVVNWVSPSYWAGPPILEGS